MSSEKSNPLEWFSSLKGSEIWFQIWNPLPALSSTWHFSGSWKEVHCLGHFPSLTSSGGCPARKSEGDSLRVGLNQNLLWWRWRPDEIAVTCSLARDHEKSLLSKDSCIPAGVSFQARQLLCGSTAGKDAGGPPDPWPGRQASACQAHQPEPDPGRNKRALCWNQDCDWGLLSAYPPS